MLLSLEVCENKEYLQAKFDINHDTRFYENCQVGKAELLKIVPHG